MKHEAAWLLTAVALAIVSFGANAATTYTSQDAFFEAVGPHLTDDYEDPGYQHGDVTDAYFDVFTNAGMNAVFGETRYRPTFFLTNIISAAYAGGNSHYCAGCNGSFELDFTGTSIGNASGVYAVSLHILDNLSSSPYVAFVTYGDNSTQNFSLPTIDPDPYFTDRRFWGVTSDKRIKSIHFGGYDGLPTYAGEFVIDDLTIASAASVPVAVDDGPVAVTEGVATIIPVGANDTNFTKPVTVTVTTLPAKGTITAISSPGPEAEMTITYTANIGAVGADSFVYEMTDSTASSDSATVTIDISPDSDSDGVSDANDNCTLASNPTQLDADGDGYGNRCDGDFNNTSGANGGVNTVDYSILRSVMNKPSSFSAYAANSDLNGDGVVDTTDYGIFRTLMNKLPGPSGFACAGTIPCP